MTVLHTIGLVSAWSSRTVSTWETRLGPDGQAPGAVKNRVPALPALRFFSLANPETAHCSQVTDTPTCHAMEIANY
jgi:hypothetical protein